VPLAKN
jgi:hypothetical protein